MCCPWLYLSLGYQVILVNWGAEGFGIEGAAVGSVEEIVQSVRVAGCTEYPSVARESLMTQACIFCSAFQGCDLCSRVYMWLGELLSV